MLTHISININININAIVMNSKPPGEKTHQLK